MDKLKQKYANHPDFIGLNIKGPNDKGAVDDTLVHIVSRSGDLDDMNLLIKHGGNVNDKGDLGCSPLHYAAIKGDIEMIRLLLSHGANRLIVNEFDQTPKDCAMLARHRHIVSIL